MARSTFSRTTYHGPKDVRDVWSSTVVYKAKCNRWKNSNHILILHIPPPPPPPRPTPCIFLDSYTNFNLNDHSIPGHQVFWATKPIRWGYLRWTPDVIGTKILITNAAAGDKPGPLSWQVNTLPRRYKCRLVPHGRTSASYTCHYYIKHDS